MCIHHSRHYNNDISGWCRFKTEEKGVFYITMRLICHQIRWVDFEKCRLRRQNKEKENIEKTSSSRKKKNQIKISRNISLMEIFPTILTKYLTLKIILPSKDFFLFSSFFKAQDRVGSWGCSAFEHLTSSLHNSRLRYNVFDFAMDLPVTILANDWYSIRCG